MSVIYELDLYFVKMYPLARNELSVLRPLTVIVLYKCKETFHFISTCKARR